jgi:hypothetical protein
MTTESTSTTASTLNFDKYLKPQKLRTEALTFMLDKAYSSQSIGAILSQLSATNDGQAQLFVEAISALSVDDLLEFSRTSGDVKTAKKPSVDVPSLDNSKDATVREGWKSRVLAILEAAQMNGSRGMTPAKIREAVGSGSEQQARDMFAEMVDAKLIASTGGTKGKKFVVARLLAEAEVVYAAEQKAKKEAEAAKAKADAEKATAAATTPVTPAAPKGGKPKA